MSHASALVATKVSEDVARRGHEVANVKSAKSIRVRSGFGILRHERSAEEALTQGKVLKGWVGRHRFGDVCVSGFRWEGCQRRQGRGAVKNMRIIMGREQELLSFPLAHL